MTPTKDLPPLTNDLPSTPSVTNDLPSTPSVQNLIQEWSNDGQSFAALVSFLVDFDSYEGASESSLDTILKRTDVRAALGSADFWTTVVKRVEWQRGVATHLLTTAIRCWPSAGPVVMRKEHWHLSVKSLWIISRRCLQLLKLTDVALLCEHDREDPVVTHAPPVEFKDVVRVTLFTVLRRLTFPTVVV